MMRYPALVNRCNRNGTRTGGLTNEVRILYQNRTLHEVDQWDAATLS